MSKLKTLQSLITRSAFGAGVGFVSSRVTSSSHEAPDNAKAGAIAGAIVGASSAVAPKVGKVIFKRIKGRIIPIKMKV